MENDKPRGHIELWRGLNGQWMTFARGATTGGKFVPYLDILPALKLAIDNGLIRVHVVRSEVREPPWWKAKMAPIKDGKK